MDLSAAIARTSLDEATRPGRHDAIVIGAGAAGGLAAALVAVSDSGMLPRAENRVTLSGKTDAWGLPALRIRCGGPSAPGSSIHECGTARMGTDPGQSVLNPYNECWDAKGLYVTDGAAFPSLGIQNPTLTIMALTARACDQAIGAR